MTEYFPEAKSSRGKVNFELDLSSYAIKAGSKNVTNVGTWNLAKKADLANSKSNLHILDIDKLKNCTKRFKQFKK